MRILRQRMYVQVSVPKPVSMPKMNIGNNIKPVTHPDLNSTNINTSKLDKSSKDAIKNMNDGIKTMDDAKRAMNNSPVIDGKAKSDAKSALYKPTTVGMNGEKAERLTNIQTSTSIGTDAPKETTKSILSKEQ